jgi:aspartate racemase
MKKIALLGGLGPESTILYYRGIIDAFHETYDVGGYPEIFIDSVDLKRTLMMAENELWHELADELGGRFEVMRKAGAEIGAMGSNTPHKIFDEIQAQTLLPLVSIVTSTRLLAEKNNLKRLLLLGTEITMSSDFYHRQFNKIGIDIVVPNDADQNYIHDKIFSEIEHGDIQEETKKKILGIINENKKEHLDGVILGCTELPLIIEKNDVDLFYLNTTQIHIDAIVHACLAGRQTT